MEEALIKRILPHSVEAEQSVISSMLMGQEAIEVASEILTGADFYQHQYGLVFEAIVELYNEGKAVDLVTLQNQLRQKNVPPEISDMEFIRDLLKVQSTSVNVKDYATIVSEKALLRKLIKATEEVENACYLNNGSVEELLDESERKLFKLFQQKNSAEFTPIKDIVLDTLGTIEEASKTKGGITGIPTGFTDLDYKMSGLQNSDLIIFAARPAMGKTSFVLNVAEHMAIKEKKSVAIFSLEMSKQQLVNRLFAMRAQIDSMTLRNGTLKEDEWERLIEAASVIGESKLLIDDTPSITVRELRSKCRKYQLEHGLDVVMIDYLQLMQGGGRSSDSRQQEISDISRSLKVLARELNVPVIALSQLSRAVESRTDHRPVLSDLRESGAIEQDADIVMFLYRDEVYHKDTDLKGIGEVIIAKQRHGPIGTVQLAWLGDYTKFANLEK
jgi:replicative DNA helicase